MLPPGRMLPSPKPSAPRLATAMVRSDADRMFPFRLFSCASFSSLFVQASASCFQSSVTGITTTLFLAVCILSVILPVMVMSPRVLVFHDQFLGFAKISCLARSIPKKDGASRGQSGGCIGHQKGLLNKMRRVKLSVQTN